MQSTSVASTVEKPNGLPQPSCRYAPFYLLLSTNRPRLSPKIQQRLELST